MEGGWAQKEPQDSCTGVVGEGDEGETGPGPGREQGGCDGEGASRLQGGGCSQALYLSEDLHTVNAESSPWEDSQGPGLSRGIRRWESEKKVKVAQSCLTLHDPMDYTVHRILQAGRLEWVAFPFSRASSQPRD